MGRVPPRFEIVLSSYKVSFERTGILELTVMYVPPISGSAIWVWKAVIPTNCTVLPISFRKSPACRTYLETDDNKVVAMMIPKYPLETCPVGKPQTTSVAIVAIVKRAQKANNQGLST